MSILPYSSAEIPMARNWGHGMRGTVSQRATEFPCRLADPFQTALYRIAGLEVLCEDVKSMPAVNSWIRTMFSKMSSNR